MKITWMVRRPGFAITTDTRLKAVATEPGTAADVHRGRPSDRDFMAGSALLAVLSAAATVFWQSVQSVAMSMPAAMSDNASAATPRMGMPG